MASAKAANILRSKGAPFSEREIDQMPDHLAWQWIYADDKKTTEAKEQARRPEICFTGFTPSEKKPLGDLAAEVGLTVKDSVTKNLILLVIGSNPGPSKLQKAKVQGCVITDQAGFIAYVERKRALEESRKP